MKKLLILAALISCTAISAGAATFSFGKLPDADEKNGFVAAYDKNGVLCAAAQTVLRTEDGVVISGELDFGSADVNSVRVFFADDTPGSGTPGKITESVSPTPTPAPTPAPAPTSFPKIYREEAYAYNAPAMVKRVTTAYEDDGIVYKVKLLIWGEEQEFTFDEYFLIKQASDKYEELLGSNVSVLKPGDVVVLGYAFKDQPPKDVCLLYRPESADPVTVTDDFVPLYTTQGAAGGKWAVGAGNNIGYSFGIVSKVSQRYFALLQPDGSADNVTEIPMTSDTIVYSYDFSDTKSTDISSTGGIYESEISDDYKDDNDNVTEWDKGASRCYALVRTIDGVAADVFVYYN